MAPDPTVDESLLPNSPRLIGGPSQWAETLLRDQANRWRANHRRPVEAYLAAYPRLEAHPEVCLMLAANEFLIRESRGENPTLEEYFDRFPEWAHRLAEEVDYIRRAGSQALLPLPETQVESSEPRIPIRPSHQATLPKFPGYQVKGILGRGGMAIVYHAVRTDLGRAVALKVILSGAAAGETERRRMRREAETVAQLRHPNIVQIFDCGEHESCLFLCLEYVPGGTLERHISGHPIAAEQAASLVERIAAGVQAAHDAGVIHRDLKPANVLLAEDGTPKVTDFGLAKRHGESQQLTVTGTAIGTPSYLAPEQVQAGLVQVGPATDVYGLGCILYECLTGRPPFSAATVLETMRQVSADEVVPVRRLQPHTPQDLETIRVGDDATQGGKIAMDLLDECHGI